MSKEYDAEGIRIGPTTTLSSTKLPYWSDAMRGRFGRIKNPFPMHLGSRALKSRRYRPAPAARALWAAAAGRPCRLWRYLFDDAVGQQQQ
jgi:hypothetical protein